MAYSDDELEAAPQYVSDYHFEDGNHEPISFSVLPLRWRDNELSIDKRREIFLSGIVDDGLHKIYKPVTAWKYNLFGRAPKISVLFKGSYWIELRKPRKGYRVEIMSTLITIHTLHLVKKNPETSEKSIQSYLAKIFSSLDVSKFKDYLSHDILLISDAVKRDRILGKSKFLLSFIKEKPQKRKQFDKVAEDPKPTLKINVNVVADAGNEPDEDEFGVCAICDNGGDLICCDGQCMRSFHATKEAGADSFCESLGFTAAEVKVMKKFLCRNCRYNQHQCFCCRKLGSSDKASRAEVFKCSKSTCGLFYHPTCVSNVLHRDDEALAEEIQQKIADGESFTCPVHRCCVCKNLDDKKVHELQFAVCRRCPTSYHRKCLEIAFEALDAESTKNRVWEGLLRNRILLYCLKHKVDDSLATPKRDHIQFPAVPKGKKMQASNSLFSKRDQQKKSVILEDHVPGKLLHGSAEFSCKEMVKSLAVEENRSSLGRRKFDSCKVSQQSESSPEPSIVQSDKVMAAKRIFQLMKATSCSVTLDEVIQRLNVPSAHGSFPQNDVDENTTQGKCEGFVEIVDMLHVYVENGDMIVDVCCGSDFSRPLKTKLEDTGKKCFYKNYDAVQAVHDLNFERRDWMSVQKEELLPGSKLIIMVLKHPFGVYANQSIDKALEFKPKLLILIVPPATERLDAKKWNYDLVWEHDVKLPGEVNEGREKRNAISVWSRPDWSDKHRAIAGEHDHGSCSASKDYLMEIEFPKRESKTKKRRLVKRSCLGGAVPSEDPSAVGYREDEVMGLCDGGAEGGIVAEDTSGGSGVESRSGSGGSGDRAAFKAILGWSSMGFASGPQHPSTCPGSCGWLDE